jgi:hypothetical protein
VWGDWLRQHIGGPRPASLFVELATALGGFLPWTLVVPLALAAAFKARRDRAVAFALWSFVVPALFIFWVQQQRVRYLVPLLPALALLVAWWLDREAREARRRPALAVIALVLAVAAASIAPLALETAGIVLPVPPARIALVLAGFVAIGAVAALGLWSGRIAPAVPAVAALAALVLFGGGWIVDDWQNRAWNFRDVARGLGTSDRPLAVAALATDNQELLQVDFYLGRALPALRSPTDVGAHLVRQGAVVVEDFRWRTAREWLRLDVNRLRAEPVGAGVIVVRDAAR